MSEREPLIGFKTMFEKAPDTKDAMKRYKAGKAGFTDIAHLKAKGLIKRADGTKRKSDKYKEEVISLVSHTEFSKKFTTGVWLHGELVTGQALHHNNGRLQESIVSSLVVVQESQTTIYGKDTRGKNNAFIKRVGKR